MTLPTVVKPEILHIDQLLDMIAYGRLRLPAFQRPPVWKAEDMRKLFESISLQYPIGSLLFWSPLEPQRTSDYIGPIHITEQSERVAYILDGQQRLTTLYCCLAPVETELTWEWSLYYDLRKGEFAHLRKGAAPVHWFPMRSLLKTMPFVRVCRSIEEKCDDYESLIPKAEALAQAFKNYKIPVNNIEGGSLGEAIDIFSRLNTLGKRLKPDHLISAFTYSDDQPTLIKEIDDIQEGLAKKGFEDMHRMTIIKVLLLAGEIRVHRNDWEGLAKNMSPIQPELRDKAVGALNRALDFLGEELGLGTDLLLPYAYQILLLAGFFLECEEPTEKQRQTLVRWFLASAYTAWFSGANNTQINLGIDDILQLAEDENFKAETLPESLPEYVFPERFNPQASRVRLLILASLSLKPRDLRNGQLLEMMDVIRSHRKGFRIFEKGPEELMASPANRIYVKPSPGLSIKQALLGVAPPDREEILGSHAISPDAFTALAADDIAAFVPLRAKQLEAAERAFLKKWFV